MLYINFPYEKHVLRSTILKHGGQWNRFLRMWEIDKDEKDIPQNLRRYIKFNENDLSSYVNVLKPARKPDNLYTTLSVKEVKFLQSYMKNGGDAAKAAVAVNHKPASGSAMIKRVMDKPAAQKWMAAELEKMGSESRWTFEEKLKTLKKIAITAVPEDAATISEMAPQHAISAISEANKMQGHYSAEKRVNLNVDVDTDLEEIKRITSELMQQNKRDY